MKTYTTDSIPYEISNLPKMCRKPFATLSANRFADRYRRNYGNEINLYIINLKVRYFGEPSIGIKLASEDPRYPSDIYALCPFCDPFEFKESSKTYKSYCDGLTYCQDINQPRFYNYSNDSYNDHISKNHGYNLRFGAIQQPFVGFSLSSMGSREDSSHFHKTTCICPYSDQYQTSKPCLAEFNFEMKNANPYLDYLSHVTTHHFSNLARHYNNYNAFKTYKPYCFENNRRYHNIFYPLSEQRFKLSLRFLQQECGNSILNPLCLTKDHREKWLVSSWIKYPNGVPPPYPKTLIDFNDPTLNKYSAGPSIWFLSLALRNFLTKASPRTHDNEVIRTAPPGEPNIKLPGPSPRAFRNSFNSSSFNSFEITSPPARLASGSFSINPLAHDKQYVIPTVPRWHIDDTIKAIKENMVDNLFFAADQEKLVKYGRAHKCSSPLSETSSTATLVNNGTTEELFSFEVDN